MSINGHSISGSAEKIKEQFKIRAQKFDLSANWIKDKQLIDAHTELSGNPSGLALDLCCGTGRVGKALKQKGWDVKGLDICRNMASISVDYFPVVEGEAEKLPFQSGSFNLVTCRQTMQFLRTKEVLSEISRILAPQGVFIISLTVPFSDLDEDWLRKIHFVKQPLLLKFYNAENLKQELKTAGFLIQETRRLTVRESINRWMDYAPELDVQIRRKVISMVGNAPVEYKRLRDVNDVDGEIFEDWNWIILKTVFRKI